MVCRTTPPEALTYSRAFGDGSPFTAPADGHCCGTNQNPKMIKPGDVKKKLTVYIQKRIVSDMFIYFVFVFYKNKLNAECIDSDFFCQGRSKDMCQ